MSAGACEGRVAIVTGAAGGLGRVMVAALLAEGAKVAAVDVDEEGLERLAGAHPEPVTDRRLLTQAGDISDYASCEAAVAATLERLGGLHVLVNNAALGMGAIRDDHMTRLVSIDEITPDTWRRFVETNLSGAWYMTRASIARLLAQRWGRIINVTTSFFTMLRGRFHPYGPCKAGLEAMSAGHAKEFEGSGVTVNVVIPGGPADTHMVPLSSGLDRESLVPPSAMVPPVVWLCSDAADGITGNRYVAAAWDAALPQEHAEAHCRAPIAWPELAQSPVWPGGKPGG